MRLSLTGIIHKRSKKVARRWSKNRSYLGSIVQSLQLVGARQPQQPICWLPGCVQTVQINQFLSPSWTDF